MTNGIKHDHGHIIIPISTDQIFFAARSKGVGEHMAGLCKIPGTAAALNDRIVAQAKKFVYGLDDGMLQFVSERFGRQWPSTPMPE